MSENEAEVVEDAAVVEDQAEEAEAETAEAENEEGEQPSDSSPDETPKGFKKRIDKLTHNWRETERDRDYWRDLALKNQKPPEPVKVEPAPQEIKTLEDFDYDEKAYQAHVRAQIIEEARQAAIEAARGVQKTDTVESRRQEFFNREKTFQETVDDYMAVTRNNALPLTNDMLDIISEAEDGPAVLYYLGKNVDIAHKLSTLTPLQIAREIGRIETKVVAERKSEPTKAPPPPPKLEGVNAAPTKVSASNPGSDKMSTNDWLKARNKELAKKRG